MKPIRLFCSLAALLLLPTALHVSQTIRADAPGQPPLALHAPRVAVFFEPGFPAYSVPGDVSPRQVAADLRRIGITAETLGADALADPARFNAHRYAALVLPYGNTYPGGAFANMRAFHREGGSLVLSGVPFTHAATRLSAANWQAQPEWGEAVHTTSNAHAGAHGLELTGPPSDWVGAFSSRISAHAGQTVTIAAWAKDVGSGNNSKDRLYVRFFGHNGAFLSQDGPRVGPGAAWHRISATVQAPAGTAALDVSPQIWQAGRVVRLDDIAVSVGGTAFQVNGGFEAPGADWTDLGHNSAPALFGPDGIGVGGFTGGLVPGALAVAPGDPLRLAPLRLGWPRDQITQWLDPASLPRADTLIPALGSADQPVAALIIHHAAPFGGAVDVWTYRGPDDGRLGLTETLLERGVVAALRARSLLSSSQAQARFAALDSLPKPPVFADLTLPVPPRPYPTLQPKMPPPARHLYVADVRPLDRDQRLLLLSLQGLINRKQPRIYLIYGDADKFWLGQMQAHRHTGTPIPVADPLSLLHTFRREFQGAVVADPKVYVSPCVAADFAAADNLVIATPALAHSLHLPIKQDLRGRFKDNADALRFVRTALLPRLNPYLGLCLDPSILETGALDQIIAARGVTFWITGPKAQTLPGADGSREVQEASSLLARMPLEAIIRGFWWHGDGVGVGETEGVALGSRFGKVTVVSDYVPNLSVFSGVRVASLHQKPPAPPPALDRSKVYLAFTMSDGDNLGTWTSYFRDYFQDPLHGTFPVGWGLAPTLLDCAPDWAQWYYDHATPNDEFICDAGGAGYISTRNWATSLHDRDGAFRDFFSRWTQPYMDRLDLKTVRLMNVDAADIARIGPLMPQTAFFMPDYGYAGGKSYNDLTYTLPTGQPVFRSLTYGSGAQVLAGQIRTRIGATRPAFVNVFVLNWGNKLSDLKRTLDTLGPGYVPVTPSHLNMLYRQAQGLPTARVYPHP